MRRRASVHRRVWRPTAQTSSTSDTSYGSRATGSSSPRPVLPGIFRGLTTLRQLMAGSSDRAVVIADGPRYAWRGLSLDVARTFFDVAAVKRVIDMLSLYKFNVLHLHLTDDQGWRIQIPELPRLAEIGGSRALGDRPGGFYSVAQFEDIVSYAAERFVTVVPELDMPGHCAAALSAYPALVSAPGATTNLLNPDDPEVAAFVRTVLGSVATMTPGPYLHIGGDEAFGMSPDAYDRFLAMSRSAARSAGKLAVTWRTRRGRARAVATFSSTGSRLIPSWNRCSRAVSSMPRAFPQRSEYRSNSCRRSPNTSPRPKRSSGGRSTAAAAVVLSPVSHVYLDRPYRETSVDPSQDELRKRLGLSAYPRATVEQAFAWDPRGALEGTGAQVGSSAESSVVGIEAAMWAETVVDESELHFMLLPRLPGVAERAWASGPERAVGRIPVEAGRPAGGLAGPGMGTLRLVPRALAPHGDVPPRCRIIRLIRVRA